MGSPTTYVLVFAALGTFAVIGSGCSAPARSAPAASTSAPTGGVPATASAEPTSTAAPAAGDVTGLKIDDKTVGTGPAVKSGDLIMVDYTGWLTDGTKFDSSVDSGQPIQFAVGVGEVIPGWDQGVIGMQAGGVRMLTIPPSLGYGAAGYPGVIPPNATLVFEVKLLQIN